MSTQSSSRRVPISVVIPTYNRGRAVLSVLDRICRCDPVPSEILVHVDMADGALESDLRDRFPDVRVLTSEKRLGPGGGRDRCLRACTTPYAVSFDDDSYPVDPNFFASIEPLFERYPRVAILAATIWHRHEPEQARSDALLPSPSYIGCGYAIRLAAYRAVRGYLPRAVPYGMEESDLSVQLYGSGWQIYAARDLRVFHDTSLRHHQSPEITAGSIANVGLFAFLHYPVRGWVLGVAQVANKVWFCLRMGRLRGICSGILSIPIDCYRHRRYRNPLPWPVLREFLQFCRAGVT